MGDASALLEDLRARIGREVGVSDWVTIDQAKIDAFAETTGDRDWLHNDPERAARESPFGRTVAQGHLVLSHASRFAEALLPRPPELAFALNYGYDRVRFIRPVPVDSRIRGRLRLRDVRPKGDGWLLATELTVEMEGTAEPVAAAAWLCFAKLRGARADAGTPAEGGRS